MKVLLILVLFMCSPVYAELPPVVDNSVYPQDATPTATATSTSPAPNVIYEMQAHIDQLQAEIQQLTGRVEEQANLIAELKSHQTTMYSDFDERLQRVENKMPATPSQPATENLQSPPAATEPAVKNTEPPVPAPAEKVQPVTESKPVPAPIDKPVTEELSSSEVEKKEFQQAYAALRAGHTDQAIEQFKAFQAKYSSGTYSANAQFWLAEAYRVKPDNDAARTAFNEVIKKYPNSPKQAEAILKLGIIEMDSKNTDKAREYLTRVTKEFPNTTAASSASKKLAQLKGN